MNASPAGRASAAGVREAVRAFILSRHLPGESPENLRDDTPLVSSGILDSLGTLGLASFIETEFGVELDVYDTSVERFDRVSDITACVMRKQAAAVPPGEAR